VINYNKYLLFERFEEETEENTKKCVDCTYLQDIAGNSFSFSSKYNNHNPPAPTNYITNNYVKTTIRTDSNNFKTITVTILDKKFKSFSIYSKNNETYIKIVPSLRLLGELVTANIAVDHYNSCEKMLNMLCSVKKSGSIVLNYPSWSIKIISKI